MPQNVVKKRHLRVELFHSAAEYKSKNRPAGNSVPKRSNPGAHGAALATQANQVETAYQVLRQSWEGNETIKAKGICIELESALNTEIPVDKLLDNGWELLNEKAGGSSFLPRKYQTWFVPDGKLQVIASLISDYLTKTQKVKGQFQPKYRPLIDAIEKIAAAAAEQLWTEPDEPFPQEETMWFEIWLRRGASEADRQIILTQFKTLAQSCSITVGKGQITLPEHTIIAVYCCGRNLSSELALLNCIAEIRRGRDYADVFSGLRPQEQVEWAYDLLHRVLPAGDGAPFVSVLDTGINRGHPLLEEFIAETDNLTVESSWSAADDDNHGTLMAGLCLFGDLTPVLSSSEIIELQVKVEGVKIVPPPARRNTDEKLAGAYTAQGVSLAELNASTRKRVWCITTTMTEPNDPIPTSWSAQMDALASGLDNGGVVRRLFCLSAGNVPQDLWINYPESNYGYTVRNPGQAWNALCVGAYTELQTVRLSDSYRPVARRGQLSPVSSTSLDWEQSWPNKPDVVFEGGNAGIQDANGSTLTLDELMLLSTHADYADGVFGVTNGTSSAAALAARMAGRIVAEYPELSPETVRGLMVHSAEWTEAMKQSTPGTERRNKRKRANFLLRTVGYGTPSLRKALECMNNHATLIAECKIQPFKKEDDEVSFNEMHLHQLPWPFEALRAHSTENIKMRVTLSYFVEPNPGNRGYTSQFRYANCALRFKVSSPGQTAEDLKAEVSKVAADEFARDNRTLVSGSKDGWTIGQPCFRGSVHSDIWEGSAADLLSMRHIAVFPVAGWWRTRSSHDRAEASLNYSLIVSLESDNPAIDIYTEISNIIDVPVRV